MSVASLTVAPTVSRRLRSWAPILLLTVILLGTLIVGRGTPETGVAARTRSIASSMKCLVCAGQSVEESRAGSARLIHQEIERQVKEGRTDAQIRNYLVSRYGKELLLRPEGTGAGAVVWALPVVFTILAFAGLAVMFRKWQRATQVAARRPALSADDAALVAAARATAKSSARSSQTQASQTEASHVSAEESALPRSSAADVERLVHGDSTDLHGTVDAETPE